MDEIVQREPGRRTIRHNLQQRIRELELLLVERRQQLEMADARIRQLEKRLHAAGLSAD
jgi:phage shock protein A